MPSMAINFGRVLIIIGIIGYGYGYMNGYASVTAFIPAFFGIALMVLGHLAKAKDSLRKHLMHAAVLIALLGFLASAGRLLSKITEITLSAAVISQLTMAIICFLFVAISVRFFMNARKQD